MSANSRKLFILQCDARDANRDLIACARYNIENEFSNQHYEISGDEHLGVVHIVFIIQLPRIAGGCFSGFQVYQIFKLNFKLSENSYVATL